MRAFSVIWLVMLASITFGQVNEQYSEELLLNIVENLAEELEADFDYATILEDLKFYAENPINVNKATYQELATLRIIPETAITSLLDYVEQNGNLLNIYELQAVPGWDLDLIYGVVPFLKVKGGIDDLNLTFGQLFGQGRFQLMSRYRQILEEQKGYIVPDSNETRQYYFGSQYNFYNRFRYNYGSRLSYGFTMEKDAGEEFFQGSQKRGFDFYSGHFLIRDVGPFKTIALGDFEAKFGQGLIIWSSFGFRKSPEVMRIKKDGEKIRPYTSVDENNFLRGGAFTLEFGDFEFTAFGSYKYVDANIAEEDTIEDEVVRVTSFQESGFHRTESELEDRKSLEQLITGGNLSYNTRKWHVGANVVYTSLGSDLNRDPNLYQIFDFQGSDLLNASLDYHAIIKNWHFFGELAMSDNGGIGAVQGLLLSIDHKIDVSMMYRHFEPDFQSLYSNGFAESSRAINEKGFYFGMKIKPNQTWTIDAYADLFRHPWLRSQADAPSHGSEFYGQVSYTPSKSVSIYTRFKHETKWMNQPDNDNQIDFLAKRDRTNLRFNVVYKPSKTVRLQSRAELSLFKFGDTPRETGFLIFQDITYSPLDFPLSGSARFALFRTDGFDTRIYAYENDVLYFFSVPAYQDHGIRYYFLVKYRVTRNLDIWARFSQSYFSNRDTLGSGNDEINGNTRSEIKLQMRLKF